MLLHTLIFLHFPLNFYSKKDLKGYLIVAYEKEQKY